MRERVLFALGFAVLSLLAGTGVSEAASDRTDVMITTGAAIIALMVVYCLGYLFKRALGLNPRPPAPQTDDHGAAHH